MPVLTTHRLGEPCWVDFMSNDVSASRDFYSTLFGWESQVSDDDQYGGYITFHKNGHNVAGLGGAMGGSDAPDAWTTYLLVEDAEATEGEVVAAGGQVFAPTMTVGDQGRLAVVADPGGAAVGLWQPAEHRGYELAAEVGSVVWHELNARDFDSQVGFYSEVFGWKPAVLSDTEEFRYVTFGPAPDNPVGGVYDAAAVLPPGMPSSWLVYFGVDDVDASAARVSELGGTVVREPWDSEFGRFCQVTDSTGGFFVLSSVMAG